MTHHDSHYVGDGRGRRRVLVNGNVIKHVVWADITRGVLLYHPSPLRLHNNGRDEIHSRRLRGSIEVIMMEDSP